MAVIAQPRARLAVLPTPLVAAPELARALGITGPLLVKRDDLTGFAVAGNKARQLEFLVAEAVAINADALVTGGGPSSNFIQATAAAAAHAGMRCELAIAGSPLSSAWPPNLAAATAWGARVNWTGDDARDSVDAMLPRLAQALMGQGFSPYVMPRGGANVVGCEGCFVAAAELIGQLVEQGLAGDGPAGDGLDDSRVTVVLAVGSGGTMAGLLAGMVAAGRPCRVVGASVSRPPEETRARVLTLAGEVAARHGLRPPTPDDVELVDARGAGHGIASPEGEAAARDALRAEGLVLDPVYTAKAMAVVPVVARDGPVVFWHTGGLLDAVASWSGGAR